MNTNQNPAVLIVEDEYMNAWALALILKPHFVVRHAATAEEARYWLNREVFSFIMMDIRLGTEPRAGFELLREARDIQPDVVIFATTGMGMGRDADSFLEAGFNAYYPKPILEAQVLADMLRICGRDRAA